MSDKLKPCPFCGGEGIVQSIDFYPDYSDPPIWWVVCVTCGAHTDEYVGETKANAVKAWNTRAERTCHWIGIEEWKNPVECSECGVLVVAHVALDSNYCPNCGAKVVE